MWNHPDFGPLAVQFENPPPVERFKEIVRTVGSAAKDSGRVEVPFSCIIPPENEWWTTDSRGGIDVPLGRAGAMKLQHLDLGHGTSQHVLISGKTGSGKSTLLHVLITNLALRYSPDEVELYLVDFKKGVEFKAYARSLLPHARVVAIESEREFGLSVLQRLDAELRTRGDMFRKRGTQDVKAYRAVVPDARLPRILLIIDEFQELFVEDDRIAQESALLLDRLVRQGRAFGIHVLLGSQTLGGAYTLGPQHDRADGRAHRVAVQRSRRPSDPQRRQHRRPAADPARRSDLQRRQRPVRRQPSLPNRLAGRPSARRLSAAHQPTRPTAARRRAAADRLRGQRVGRPGRQSDLEGIDRVAASGRRLRRPSRRGSARPWPSRIRPRRCSCVRTAATC